LEGDWSPLFKALTSQRTSKEARDANLAGMVVVSVSGLSALAGIVLQEFQPGLSDSDTEGT